MISLVVSYEKKKNISYEEKKKYFLWRKKKILNHEK